MMPADIPAPVRSRCAVAMACDRFISGRREGVAAWIGARWSTFRALRAVGLRPARVWGRTFAMEGRRGAFVACR